MISIILDISTKTNKLKDSRLLPKVLIGWCRWWDSNPHGFPQHFECCAYTNFATSALRKNITTNTFFCKVVILYLYVIFLFFIFLIFFSLYTMPILHILLLLAYLIYFEVLLLLLVNQVLLLKFFHVLSFLNIFLLILELLFSFFL